MFESPPTKISVPATPQCGPTQGAAAGTRRILRASPAKPATRGNPNPLIAVTAILRLAA